MTTGPRDERRDLVLAAAQDYGWEDLRPFLESLRATGFDGDVVFFATGLSEATRRRLWDAGVELVRPFRARLRVGRRVFQPYTPKTTRVRWHVQPLYGRLVRALATATPDRRATTNRLSGALANVEVARYFWYHRYLSRTVSRYRNVMLTDVRDVVFLGSPFGFEIGDDAHFFLEDERYRIADQVNNRGWLIGAYGERALDELGDRPISCSGITIGAAPAVLAYLDVMVDHLARLARQFKGMDQGVHNYVLHTGLVPRARLVPNRGGPVLTAGLMDPADAAVLVEDPSAPVRVVHQYDRNPELRERVLRRAYAGATDTTPIP